MFFWGPFHGPGVVKKLAFSFADLEPDGCLVADQLKVHAKHLKSRVQINKRGASVLGGDPAKKLYSFCDGQMFLYGYAESSSSRLITTKSTKDTEKKWPIILSFLRDLRVLRG